MSEIGGEFCIGSARKGKNEYKTLINYPKRYVLSGRTGLYLIAAELKNNAVQSIALPAYCCGSMVAPFADAGLDVSFYQGYSIPDTEAILIMDYFGFIKEETSVFAKNCSESGLKILVDATQTAFSASLTYEYADYIVVSYRKWFDCLCAAVYSKNGYTTDEYTSINNAYSETWRSAAKKKKLCLEDGIGNKQDYLDLYAKANHMLANDYIGYKACSSEIELFENTDSDFIRNTRRNNAKTLLCGLSEKADLLFEQMSDNDCPLHIPVILEPDSRTRIRKALIGESIYCPCHWPIDKQYPYLKTPYHDKELSLICDQRYTEEDMISQVKAVIDAINKEGSYDI